MSVVPFLTAKSASISVTPFTLSVPWITVLPVALATVNLSAVPFLTANAASTSTVPLNSVLPATSRVP